MDSKNNQSPIINYKGSIKSVNQLYHDGLIRPAVGVQHYQVLRANRSVPQDTDGRGCTYNHQPMIAYWKGSFYVQYLGSHHDEHEDPTETFLTQSEDSRIWTPPCVAFPAIEWSPGKYTIAHQRMGFYVAPNGRLLVLSFYGLWREGDWAKMPNSGYGLGRAVREVYENGSLGPIYFIRYMPHAGYTESNTSQWYPFYQTSEDDEFIQACDVLLANKLMTQQWWEEDRSSDGFFAMDNQLFNCKAFCFYHRKDGKVVGLWKNAWSALSEDEGSTWSTPEFTESKPTGTAKEWGQRTSDDCYAIVWTPTTDADHRYPLCVITSEDGIEFDGMLLVQGEVPLQRFTGWHRELGPQYIRGIEEGNGLPPDGHMWMAYSMNKEDIWVCCIPVPILGEVIEDVDDNFEDMTPGGLVRNWNIYSPLWAPVYVERNEGNQYLRLADKDPYDYAKAIRIFQSSAKVKLQFDVRAMQIAVGRLEIDVLSPGGTRPVQIVFDSVDKLVKANKGAGLVPVHSLEANHWYSFQLDIDVERFVYDLSINGELVMKDARLATWVFAVERLEFRTGPYRREDARPYQDEPVYTEGLLACDYPEPLAVYHVDNVKISKRG
ncbi:hypothetical protein EHS13_33730 [Paenibacillus psychroresistens]|uniref:Six-hairpin glycosidase n=1 Tax=Paenibacillus psychroresistens TaxID=1778678 RepID=A0A6B8RSQ6_9BACL|nr:hypothetical protein [Paenibacillus psychroresistens]QGQ99470.1 hypothetical protein EHS13_33730 [Paenibacillus psychroresistens]